MNRLRGPCLLAVSLFAVAGVVGCGGDNKRDTGASSGSTTGAETGKSEAGATGPASETINVGETEYKLSPANPTVKQGGTVEVVAKNNGTIEHAIEVEGPSGEARTQPIAPGKSATLKVKLDKPGSYTWYCPIDDHRQKGMIGKITVAGAGSSGGAAAPKPDTGGGAGSGSSSGGTGY